MHCKRNRLRSLSLGLVLCMVLLCYPGLAQAATRNVPGTYPTIQAAIDAASGGDIVLVDDGIYTENIDFSGKAITVQSVNGAANTTIDGNASGSVVTFTYGEGVGSVLDGFTITNGSNFLGGGIFCIFSSPTVVNSILWGNETNGSSNEVYLYDAASSLDITYSDIDTFLITGSGSWSGSNNINADPLFVGGGDYHLTAGSPCLDRGTNAGAPADDIDGDARPYDVPSVPNNPSAYDMGADEYIAVVCMIYVPTDFSTIQEAINAASDGCLILVDDGIYTENINFNGKAITVRSENGVASTIIDGSNLSDPNLGSVVIFASGEGIDSVLDGFTITGGSGTDPSGYGTYGGGIYCHSSSPSITNCIIKENTASRDGGGIACYESSSPTITNCTISSNTTVHDGGGIVFHHLSKAKIENCTITGNNATGDGGGISCPNGSPSPEIINCVISNNTAIGDGGGIYFGYTYSSLPPITNCIIINNIAREGGGVYCSSSFSPVIKNCTISDNTASSTGGGILCKDNSSPTIINSILWGDSPNEIYLYIGSSIDITYSDVQGGWTGEGNINADPQFVGGGDYHLTTSSPCIDSATNIGAPSNDIDGDARPYDVPSKPNNPGAYDMGADEYVCPPINDQQAILDAYVGMETALEAEDIDGVMAYIASNFMEGGDNRDAFQSMMELFFISCDNINFSFDITNIVVNGNIATCTESGNLTSTCGSGTSNDTEYWTKENCEWKYSGNQVGCSPPSTPSNLLPANEATEVSLNVDLDWEDNSRAASYDVHFGTNPSPLFVANVTSSTYNPGSLNPNTSYYWKVVAKNICGNTEGPAWSFTTVNSEGNNIPLTAGWNLISLPLQPSDNAIESVLSGISDKYESVWVFMNGNWKVYDPANPDFSDLLTMEAGWGYWIKMTEAATLSVSGTTPSDTVDLVSGWNLVGYNSTDSQDIADALASIDGKYISVWAFIDGAWKVYDPANPDFSDLLTMEPDYGYWINTKEPCTWTLP